MLLRSNTFFFCGWDFSLRRTVNSTFTSGTHRKSPSQYLYLLHFTSLHSCSGTQVTNHSHPQPNDPLRTTYYSTIQPQPQSILHLPSRLKQQAKSHSIPHLIAKICETTYNTNHLRTHENIRRGYLFCSMYSRSIRVP